MSFRHYEEIPRLAVRIVWRTIRHNHMPNDNISQDLVAVDVCVNDDSFFRMMDYDCPCVYTSNRVTAGKANGVIPEL